MRYNLLIQKMMAAGLVLGAGTAMAQAVAATDHQAVPDAVAADSALAVAQAASNSDNQAGQGAPADAATVTAVNGGDPNVVVVTANRIKTNAQRTPVALSVLSATALSDAGVSSVQAMQAIDPSVNVTSNAGAGYVAMRGIASADVTEIGDPSVPIARDGFFVNRSFSMGSSMYDLERVEVLKGPQGTLFGRNSTGGLINIITKRPGQFKGGFFSLDVGNYNAVTAEGAVNVPLSDTVQLRVSGISRRHDGYRELTGIGIEGDDAKSWSGRVQLAFQPIKGFDGLVSYQHDHVNEVGDVVMNTPLGEVASFGDAKSFHADAPSFNRIRGDRLRWDFSYDQLPYGLTLSYAGGYDKQTWNHGLDGTATHYPAVRQYLQDEAPDTWNHEVRLATPQSGRFAGQVGLFHFDEKNTINSGLLNLRMDPQYAGGPLDFGGLYGIRFNYRVRTKSDAVFGQGSVKLTEDLKLTAGARYTKDRKERNGESVMNSNALISPFVSIPFSPTSGNGSLSSSKPTWQAGLDWTVAPDNFLYAKMATGYKSGGFNSVANSPTIPYGEENVRSYEIGSKNKFDNRRITLNLAAFYQDYKGYQASQTINAVNGGASIITFNVGNATIKGLEAEFNARLGQSSRFDLSATWLHARFGDNILVADGDTPPVLHDIGGNTLPNAPRLVYTAAFEHNFEIGDSTLTMRLSGKHSSEFNYMVFNHRDTRSPAYTTGNLVFTYARNNSDWQLQAYVNNFTDEVVLANAQRSYTSGHNTYQFQPPRTFGARMRYNF